VRIIITTTTRSKAAFNAQKTDPANLPGPFLFEQPRWYRNRHIYAFRVAAGVNIRTVAARLGRATIQMMVRYAHLPRTTAKQLSTGCFVSQNSDAIGDRRKEPDGSSRQVIESK
jgi:hypothetical protein